MEKQTAVEWLFIKLYETIEMKGDGKVMDALLKEAKEMEKQQIIDAANTLLYTGPGPGDMWAEQYYNRTYKNK